MSSKLYTILSGLTTFGQNMRQAFIDYDAELAPLLNFPVVEQDITYSSITAIETLSGSNSYSLEDLKMYKTEATADTTFILPQIEDTDVHHEIVISVKLNGQYTITFKDHQNNTLETMDENVWDSGDVIEYLIRYEGYLSKWCIMSVKMA